MKRKKTQGLLIATTCLGLAFAFGPVGSLAAQDHGRTEVEIMCQAGPGRKQP